MLDIKEIRALTRQRYPMLMIDRILEINETEKKIVGLKNVTINEPFFQGHFPANPIMPGVLILEAMVQASEILATRLYGLEDALLALKTVDKVKFRQLVVPGDQLIIESAIIETNERQWKLIAQSYVDKKMTTEAEFTLVVKDKETA
jgi:beta-hydroxyacyl-ACP dehydratase FabZ